jgi:hypothetical protein
VAAKRKHLTKLASLSALGAGAVALTAPSAEAGIVAVHALNAKVGFDTANGFGPSFGVTLPGAFFSFHTYSRAFSSGCCSSGSSGIARWIQIAVGSMGFAAGNAGNGFIRPLSTSYPNVSLVGPGVLFGSRSIRSRPLVGGRVFGRSFFRTTSRTPTSSGGSSTNSTTVTSFFAYPFGHGPFQNKFALFQFGDPFNPNYGWVKLSYDVTNSTSGDGAFGPNLTILAYGYETDAGVQIAAGDEGTTATPEPASFALSGLGALAFGATGLRRWRKARKAA